MRPARWLYICTVMLVDVVLMRERGHRLPREVLLSAPATRGELRLAGADPGATGVGDDITATLTQRDGTAPVLELERARVVRMRGQSMVISGAEAGGAGTAQAWWVRRVCSSTLLDVLQTCRAGIRLAPAMLDLAAPVRGDVQITPGRPGYHSAQRNAPLLAGIVEAGQIEWALVPLDQARVTRIIDREMVIVGVEEVLEGRTAKRYQQAWRVHQPESASAASGQRPRRNDGPVPFPLQRSFGLG